MKSTFFQLLIPELLGQIFEKCIPDLNDVTISTANQAPLKLGRVCSYWRKVALSTPALWDHFKLIIPRDPSEGAPVADADAKAARKAQAFLQRSACRPVSIRLSCYSSEGMALVTRELLLHAPRWLVLKLRMPAECFKPFVAALARGVPLTKVGCETAWNANEQSTVEFEEYSTSLTPYLL